MGIKKKVFKELEKQGCDVHSIISNDNDLNNLIDLVIKTTKKVVKKQSAHSHIAIVRFWNTRGHFNAELYNRIVQVKNA